MSRSEGDPQILVVCTANICRSPMFEGMLARGVATAGAGIVVSSAGLLDWDEPVDRSSVLALERFGIDISGHRSRPLSSVDLTRFDLVLTMTREHVREVVERDVDMFRRTFTVKEFDRRVRGVRDPIPGTGFRSRAEFLSEGRTGASLLGSSVEDDVIDPYGGSKEEFDVIAEQLFELSARISPRLVAMVG